MRYLSVYIKAMNVDTVRILFARSLFEVWPLFADLPGISTTITIHPRRRNRCRRLRIIISTFSLRRNRDLSRTTSTASDSNNTNPSGRSRAAPNPAWNTFRPLSTRRGITRTWNTKYAILWIPYRPWAPISRLVNGHNLCAILSILRRDFERIFLPHIGLWGNRCLRTLQIYIQSFKNFWTPFTTTADTV